MGQIKGSAMINIVKALRAFGAERAKEILPNDLHRYVEHRVLASSWYPEQDNLLLMRAYAELVTHAAKLDENVYVQMGRAVAIHDLTGIYARSLRPQSTDGVLTAISAIWRSYHDTGVVTAQLVAANRVRVELTGYGHPSPEMCAVSRGWTLEFLERNGCTGLTYDEVQCRNRGDATCVWDGRWTHDGSPVAGGPGDPSR